MKVLKNSQGKVITLGGDAIIQGGASLLDKTINFSIEGQPYHIASYVNGQAFLAPSNPVLSASKIFNGWRDENLNLISFPYSPTQAITNLSANFLIVPSIPSDYQTVEYIKFTGNEYLNTEISPSMMATNPKLITAFRSDYTGDVDYFGTMNNSQNTIIGNFVISPTASTQYLRWGTTTGAISSIPSMTEFYQKMGIMEISGLHNINIIINGNLSNYTLANNSMVHTGPIYIGRGRSIPNNTYWRYFKLADGSTNLFEGVACRRKSDSVGGMYDVVSQTFIENAGSGTIIVGPDIN